VTPAEPPLDQITRNRRWRLFMAVECLPLLIAAVIFAWVRVTHHAPCWVSLCLRWLFVYFVYTLPICFLYLIGRPPVMTLSPLMRSRESRASRMTSRTAFAAYS
jgi:hypothetical protein